ncbi:MAG: MATE family efflux transporter [Oscillospiraceae bacterium]|nr:MATE family efflux transporter [Oscillospiraceae bacterium]
MLKLALPIAFQNLLLSSAHLIDTAMIIGLGNAATAAIGIAGRWMFLLNLGIFGVSSAAATLVSQYWGAKEYSRIQNTLGVALLVAVSFGVVFNAGAFFVPEAMMSVFTNEAEVITLGAEYLRSVSFYAVFITFSGILGAVLRATEDVITPLVAAVVGNVTDTALSFFLIYGKLGLPALGMKGAAYGTWIAAVLQCSLLIVMAFARKSMVFAAPRELFRMERVFVKKFFSVASPVILNELFWAVGTNIYSMVLARQGNENYAAYTTFAAVQEMSFVFFVGVCHACAIMTGKSIGEGKLREARKIANRFVIVTPLMGVLVGAGMILLRNPVLSLLPIETEGARQTTAVLLLMYGFWLPVRMIPYTSIVGVFRAGGDVKVGLFYDLFSLYALGIPIVLVFGLAIKVSFPLLVFLMFAGEDVVKTVLCLFRMRSGKWIHVLTD